MLTMRITGGKYCGRKVIIPNGELEIRPAMDRMRESLFSPWTESHSVTCSQEAAALALRRLPAEQSSCTLSRWTVRRSR